MNTLRTRPVVFSQNHEGDNYRLEDSHMDCLGCNVQQNAFSFAIEFGTKLWHIARRRAWHSIKLVDSQWIRVRFEYTSYSHQGYRYDAPKHSCHRLTPFSLH